MNRNRKVIFIAVLAMLATFILPRFRTDTKAANRICDAFHKAQAPVLRPDSDLSDSVKFCQDLKAIDMTGAPADVREAMGSMIRHLDEFAVVYRVGGNIPAAQDKVAYAKRDLLRALERWRGQPF